jgi:hypothetical protein
MTARDTDPCLPPTTDSETMRAESRAVGRELRDWQRDCLRRRITLVANGIPVARRLEQEGRRENETLVEFCDRTLARVQLLRQKAMR